MQPLCPMLFLSVFHTGNLQEVKVSAGKHKPEEVSLVAK